MDAASNMQMNYHNENPYLVVVSNICFMDMYLHLHILTCAPHKELLSDFQSAHGNGIHFVLHSFM